MWTGYVYLTLKTQHPEATHPFPLSFLGCVSM